MSLFGSPNIEKMKAKRDIQGLVKALHSQNLQQVKTSAEALIQIGGEGLNLLLQDRDPNVRKVVSALIKDINIPTDINPSTLAWIVVLKQNWSKTTDLSLNEIVSLGRAAVAPLCFVLKENDYDTARYYSAKALGQIGDLMALETLIAALKDENYDVRKGAAEALGKIGDGRASDALYAALNVSDLNVRSTVKEVVKSTVKDAIIAIGAPGLESSCNALKNNDAGIRRVAADVLGESRDPEAVIPLINALKDNDEYVPDQARKSLIKIGLTAVVPLCDALKDNNQNVRGGAAFVLGKIGTEIAVESLCLSLKDSDYLVRLKAIEALENIGSVKAVGPLVDVLKDRDSRVRRLAAKALKKIGLPADVDEAVEIWFAIGMEDWKHVISYGKAAVEPLR